MLLRVFKRRAELDIPIESIVCSATINADLTKGNGNDEASEADADALVDSVEFSSNPGNWEVPPAFRRRMAALLEEHLNLSHSNPSATK